MQIAEQEQVRVTVRVPASLVSAFERVADREERTLSAEVRYLMRRRVEESGLEPAQQDGGSQ
jgi:hypothetical protein